MYQKWRYILGPLKKGQGHSERIAIQQIPAKDNCGNGVQRHFLAKHIYTQGWLAHNNQPKDPNNGTGH